MIDTLEQEAEDREFQERLQEERALWRRARDYQEDECFCADAGKCEVCVGRAVERAELLMDSARDRA